MSIQRRWRVELLWLIPVPVLLLAAEPSWSTKAPALWTEEDARQVLTASPWAREVVAGVARRLSEDEMRDAGVMGQPRGAGYDGVDPKDSGARLPPGLAAGGNQRSVRSLPGTIRLRLRWESALPVRIAELKARETGPPTTASDEGYCLAVYGIPGSYPKGDPEELGAPLKKEAALKREGKRDVKPSKVEVFAREDGLLVVYRFPWSAEITKAGGPIEFGARIGRIVIQQTFDPGAMAFLGRLEL